MRAGVPDALACEILQMCWHGGSFSQPLDSMVDQLDRLKAKWLIEHSIDESLFCQTREHDGTESGIESIPV